MAFSESASVMLDFLAVSVNKTGSLTFYKCIESLLDNLFSFDKVSLIALSTHTKSIIFFMYAVPIVNMIYQSLLVQLRTCTSHFFTPFLVVCPFQFKEVVTNLHQRQSSMNKQKKYGSHTSYNLIMIFLPYCYDITQLPFVL